MSFYGNNKCASLVIGTTIWKFKKKLEVKLNSSSARSRAKVIMINTVCVLRYAVLCYVNKTDNLWCLALIGIFLFCLVTSLITVPSLNPSQVPLDVD